MTLVTLGEFKQLESLAPKWLLLSQELGHEREDSIIAAMAAMASFVREASDERGTELLLERARRWSAPGYSTPNFHLDLIAVLHAELDRDLLSDAVHDRDHRRRRPGQDRRPRNH